MIKPFDDLSLRISMGWVSTVGGMDMCYSTWVPGCTYVVILRLYICSDSKVLNGMRIVLIFPLTFHGCGSVHGIYSRSMLLVQVPVPDSCCLGVQQFCSGMLITLSYLCENKIKCLSSFLIQTVLSTKLKAAWNDEIWRTLPSPPALPSSSASSATQLQEVLVIW
jgi:hypothetical protein